MSMSIAGFAYVGVEIIAASALEARWPQQQSPPSEEDGVQTSSSARQQQQQQHVAPSSDITVHQQQQGVSGDGSMRHRTPVFVCAIYIVGGLLVAFDLDYNDCLVNRLSWVDAGIVRTLVDDGAQTYMRYVNGSVVVNGTGWDAVRAFDLDLDAASGKGAAMNASTYANITRLPNGILAINGSSVIDGRVVCDPSHTPISPIIAVAQRSGIRGLASTLNGFLVFTAITCANTNLYVASRTFFGLTSRLRGGVGAPLLIRFFAWFGKTNEQRVPMRALIFSTAAFWWVPFLYLAPGGPDTTTPIGAFIEVLSQMGTVGVIVVWACECWAFLRFYYCLKRHQKDIRREKLPQLRRFGGKNDEDDDYPYRSNGQPVTAVLALLACLVLLFVFNGAFLWKGFHVIPFVSAYVTLLVFGLIVLALKLRKGSQARWTPIDLSDYEVAKAVFDRLNDIRYRRSENDDPPRTFANLWGRL